LFSNDYDYQIGIHSEYFNENSYNGINLNLAAIPIFNMAKNSNDFNEMFAFGVYWNEHDKNFKVNLTIANFENFKLDSNFGFCKSFKLSLISIKHSTQISSEIQWFKVGPGFGYGRLISENNMLYFGLHTGFGANDVYLNDNIDNFEKKEFHGISASCEAYFLYQIEFLKVKIINNIRALIWSDKNLFSYTPNMEASLNLSQIFSKNFKNERQMYLNIGIKNSTLYFETERNQSFIFYINLFSSIR
jgi:hypothetical protein